MANIRTAEPLNLRIHSQDISVLGSCSSLSLVFEVRETEGTSAILWS